MVRVCEQASQVADIGFEICQNFQKKIPYFGQFGG